MAASNFRICALALLFCGSVAIPLILQWRQIANLRVENASLRVELERVAPLADESVRLTDLLTESNNSPSIPTHTTREILRLRGEVSRLRRRLEESQSQAAADSKPSALDVPTAAVNDFSAETLRRMEMLLIESQAEYVRQSTLLAKLQEAALNSDGLHQAILATGIHDRLLDLLQERLLMAEQNLAAHHNDLGPGDPETEGDKIQVEDLKARIDERAQGILIGVNAKVESLKQGIEDMQAEVGRLVENARR